MQHYISDSIYGLTLAWFTSENSTKLLECRHLDSIFFHWSLSSLLLCPESTAPLAVSRPNCLCPWFHANCLPAPFQTNSLLASRYLFRPRRDFKSKNPLSGFAPKQTKESSAWRATYIVLHGIRAGWGIEINGKFEAERPPSSVGPPSVGRPATLTLLSSLYSTGACCRHTDLGPRPAKFIRPILHLVGRWPALTSRVRTSARARPSPPLNPHFKPTFGSLTLCQVLSGGRQRQI